MSFFNKLFSHSRPSDSQPEVSFGRYSDTYKEDEQYLLWDESLAAFEEGDYAKSYALFFRYLRDDEQDNVSWEQDGANFTFQIYQGSKKITGFIDDNLIKAEAKIATSDALNIGFLRRMIELNYNLKYGRYALDREDNLTLIFDSYLVDGSPYKLYYAFKELAVNADKQDDLLISEFEMLHPVNIGHVKEIPEEEKNAKFEFVQAAIQELFDTVDQSKLNNEQYSGGVAYAMLDTCYKLDYLVKPEGPTMEALERIHRLYFSQNNKRTLEKNAEIRKELEKIRDKSREELSAELYRTSATFGITSPTNHNQFGAFIDGELHHMDWYVENRYEEIACSIPGYIVGYCLFNFALPLPDRQLLHLYYQVMEPAYFTSLGFDVPFYEEESGKFKRKAIRKALEQVQRENQQAFPKFRPDFSMLDFTSRHSFAKSYLLMLRALDLTKA